jgi:hypothetical protein
MFQVPQPSGTRHSAHGTLQLAQKQIVRILTKPYSHTIP